MLKRAIDSIQRIFIVTTGHSWGTFSLIPLYINGLRLGRDVSKKNSVSTNFAEINL